VIGLPAAVLAEIERLTANAPLASLQARATAVSAHYRKSGNSAGIIRNEQDAAAYALMRLPGTYAACRFVMAEVQRLMPDFAPHSLWDIGCGPGAASLASIGVYPAITSLRLTDRLKPFLTLAQRLLALSAPEAHLDLHQADLGQITSADPGQMDVTMISYVLTELDPVLAETLVRVAWTASTNMMVLVEPGTPIGFQTIARMRQMLIGSGAHILAPCTHHLACPREQSAAATPPRWCRFVERLPRSSLHRRVKQGAHGYEDESFAYLVATRRDMAVRGGRVIGPVERNKAGLVAPLCIAGEERAFSVASRDKQKMSQFKRLDWGDQVENP
jgi:ribosomal protein RSM22 (predicted rRNA methylase)